MLGEFPVVDLPDVYAGGLSVSGESTDEAMCPDEITLRDHALHYNAEDPARADKSAMCTINRHLRFPQE
jgi:hypothetical protein